MTFYIQTVVLQLTSRSEGRRTDLVSPLQMTLKKACWAKCWVTETFPRDPRETSALTTELPRFVTNNSGPEVIKLFRAQLK